VFVWCRSEQEEAANGTHHLSEKDAAKAARKAAVKEKYASQIRQLDDMVRLGRLWRDCYT
jgi:hypothetical protein